MSACNVANLHQGVRNWWEVRAGEVVVGDRGESDPGEGDGRVGEEEEKQVANHLKVVDGNWGAQHGIVLSPCLMMHLSRREVQFSSPHSFVDANLMADMTTGRSRTGIIHLHNGTPIDWHCKNQN